jgi:hypothetical protein
VEAFLPRLFSSVVLIQAKAKRVAAECWLQRSHPVHDYEPAIVAELPLAIVSGSQALRKD